MNFIGHLNKVKKTRYFHPQRSSWSSRNAFSPISPRNAFSQSRNVRLPLISQRNASPISNITLPQYRNITLSQSRNITLPPQSRKVTLPPQSRYVTFPLISILKASNKNYWQTQKAQTHGWLQYCCLFSDLVFDSEV